MDQADGPFTPDPVGSAVDFIADDMADHGYERLQRGAYDYVYDGLLYGESWQGDSW
jgi:hypothetical protein